MNRDINGKPSLLANIAYYVKQCGGSIVVAVVAGTVASVLAIAFHFPGW